MQRREFQQFLWGCGIWFIVRNRLNAHSEGFSQLGVPEQYINMFKDACASLGFPYETLGPRVDGSPTIHWFKVDIREQ